MRRPIRTTTDHSGSCPYPGHEPLFVAPLRAMEPQARETVRFPEIELAET